MKARLAAPNAAVSTLQANATGPALSNRLNQSNKHAKEGARQAAAAPTLYAPGL